MIDPGLLTAGAGVVTLVGTLVSARFVRSGSKEANATTSWSNLVGALQTDCKSLREEIGKVDTANEALTQRVVLLERSRSMWKWWAQRVVLLMEAQGISFPPPPESLEDTNPSIRRS